MIQLQDVWKAYPLPKGKRDVLRGINLTVNRGDAVGILGRNGAGKSTLLRVVSGVEKPSEGRIVRDMSISWPLATGFGVQASLTGLANARFIARIYGQPVNQTVDFVREFSELGAYLNMPVRTYSAGMHGRLLFALSLAVDFDCYLIDESTSAGDARFNERVKAALKERLSRSSLIMVSHFPEHIRMYCRSAAILNRGTLKTYDSLDEAIAAYYTL